MRRPPWLSKGRVAAVQGAYYLLSGLWPLVAIDLFLSITGPKEELWLVRAVAGLLVVAGFVLLLAGLRRRVGVDVRILGMGFAAVLAVIDVVYVWNGTIRPVFLLDAAVEVAVLVAWALARRAPVPSRTTGPGRARGT